MRTRWPDYSERLKALHESASDSGDPTNLLSALPIRRRLARAAARGRAAARDLDARGPFARRGRDDLPLGQRRSFCVAHYLAYALAQLGVQATLIDNVGGLGPDQMARATERDALIAISFSPYTPITIAIAQRARAAGTPIVVITDSALGPLAGLADVRFEIVESDFGAFRSLSATFCLAMTLAVAVAEKRRRSGLKPAPPHQAGADVDPVVDASRGSRRDRR